VGKSIADPRPDANLQRGIVLVTRSRFNGGALIRSKRRDVVLEARRRA
jgi:hypothetical protein